MWGYSLYPQTLRHLQNCAGSYNQETLVFEAQPADLILLSVGSNPNRISDEHAGAQNLYDEALAHGMVHLGTFPFGRVNYIWVLGYPETELAKYLQEKMDFREQP